MAKRYRILGNIGGEALTYEDLCSLRLEYDIPLCIHFFLTWCAWMIRRFLSLLCSTALVGRNVFTQSWTLCYAFCLYSYAALD